MPVCKQNTYYEVRYKRRIFDEDCDYVFEMGELYTKLYSTKELGFFLKKGLVEFSHENGKTSYFDPLNDFIFKKITVKTRTTTIRRKFNIPNTYLNKI